VLEALAYDTASIVMDVIQKNRPSSRSAFAEALKAVKDFPAVSGDTTFGPSREARRRLTPLVIDGEQIVELQ
jgi:ABC-type branched-subunit amino acid transport system substrate-binding protein